MKTLNVFITGTSSGLGDALAGELLNAQCQIYGYDPCEYTLRLLEDCNYLCQYFDLASIAKLRRIMISCFHDISPSALGALNAGQHSPFGDMDETSIDIMKLIVGINMWLNNVINPGAIARAIVCSFSDLPSKPATSGYVGLRDEFLGPTH